MGEIGFFTGNIRNASAVSNGITILIMIERKKFIEILGTSPKDYVIFLKILFNLGKILYDKGLDCLF